MQREPHYDDVVREVREFLAGRALACERAGIARTAIVLDPGFGFGKTVGHNLNLLTGLASLCELDYPVLAGLSRKSMLAALLNRPGAEDPAQRVSASVAAAMLAWQQGARWFRVHDVQPTVDALRVVAAVETRRA
jgi:dihydropteroate synthase